MDDSAIKQADKYPDAIFCDYLLQHCLWKLQLPGVAMHRGRKHGFFRHVLLYPKWLLECGTFLCAVNILLNTRVHENKITHVVHHFCQF